MPDSIDALVIRRWCATGLELLRRYESEINELNVYPVPDGDTGTNLVLTMTAAAEALAIGPLRAERAVLAERAERAVLAVLAERAEPPVSDGAGLGPVLRRLARGALLGARGNSGVILAQLLAGLADSLATVPAADGRAIATAFGRAALSARAAVAEPVEGTMLSVADAAAGAAAHAAQRHSGAGAVVTAIARAAREALARTPEQLPILARAGVVDAGGRGLVVLLNALVEVVVGEVPPDPPAQPSAPHRTRMPLTIVREIGSERYAYEVQYLLDGEAAAVDHLRQVLGTLGDSLVVVGSAGSAGQPTTWNVHVHVNDVGAAIEEGIRAGRPYRISVTRFASSDDKAPDAHHEPSPADPARLVVQPPMSPISPPVADAAARTRGRAAVVVCRGAGLSALFAAEGAVPLSGSGGAEASGSASGTPSTAEILAAIRATGAGQVVILPNDRGVASVAAVAAATAREAGIHAGVVPTRSPVQALAALAVRDLGRRFEDDVVAMAEAAGACRYAEVTVASREALTLVGRCQPGDVLALVEGEVNLIGQDLVETCRTLLDRLLAAGGELVTLVAGVDAPDGLTGTLAAHLAERWPFVEVQTYDGGQPLYPLLVGVE